VRERRNGEVRAYWTSRFFESLLSTGQHLNGFTTSMLVVTLVSRTNSCPSSAHLHRTTGLRYSSFPRPLPSTRSHRCN
jgi:hypothetical protein